MDFLYSHKHVKKLRFLEKIEPAVHLVEDYSSMLILFRSSAKENKFSSQTSLEKYTKSIIYFDPKF